MKSLAKLLTAALLAAMSLPATAADTPAAKTEKAYIGGGCFWCVEAVYEELPGVIATISGYMGGKTKNPTYPQVSTGSTGHNEVVQVSFDPAKVSYAQLLETFWRNIDPTQANGQFCDHGSQYRSEIFFHDDSQRKLAEASKAALQKNKPFAGEIHTLINRASQFYPAEEYHQDYYRKNPARYSYYKAACGREARLKELWKSH